MQRTVPPDFGLFYQHTHMRTAAQVWHHNEIILFITCGSKEMGCLVSAVQCRAVLGSVLLEVPVLDEAAQGVKDEGS